MQKIGDSTSTANGAGEYTQGQPGSGIDATMITAAWLNAVQREIVSVIVGAGIPLNPADDSQLFKAIQAIQTAANAWAKLTGKPTTVSGFGITDAFTKTEVSAAIQQAVADLVASSPAALNTLKELAGALGGDPNFAVTMMNALAGKANKAATLFGYGITDAQPYSVYLSDYHKNGGYGLGGTVAPAPEGAWDSAIDGKTRFIKGAGPSGVTVFSGLHIQVDGARYVDFAARINQAWFRTYEGTGQAQWHQFWHSGNLTPAQVASNEAVIAGVDDTAIVTPKKLRLGVTWVFGDNGYLAFPSWLGGFIIQWGTSLDDGATRSFPTAFPTECFCLVGTINSDAFGGGSLTSFIVSRTQFRLREGAGATANPMRYIALGN